MGPDDTLSCMFPCFCLLVPGRIIYSSLEADRDNLGLMITPESIAVANEFHALECLN